VGIHSMSHIWVTVDPMIYDSHFTNNWYKSVRYVVAYLFLAVGRSGLVFLHHLDSVPTWKSNSKFIPTLLDGKQSNKHHVNFSGKHKLVYA
jgi:hypothetical protein